MADRDQAQQEWEEVFRNVSGRDPNAEDYNDFDMKWRHTGDYAISQGDTPEYGTEGVGYDNRPDRREWSDLLRETEGDLRERFPDGGGGGGGGGTSYRTQSGGSGGSGGGGGGDSTTQRWIDFINNRDRRFEERNNQLWSLYTQGATRALDPNSPEITAAGDAYGAGEERSRRSYMADLAERSGPYANLQAEERLGHERVGQRTGAYMAQLRIDELNRQRDQIMQYMGMMGNQLRADQAMELQETLGGIDAELRQQGLALQSRGLDQDWQRALMQNDQFMATLGLNAEDRAAYWDAVRRGLL